MGREFPAKKVQWDNSPVTEQPDFIPIVCAQAGGATEWHILSAGTVGVWTHYFDGRTSPCIGLLNHCPGCGPMSSTKRKFYLAVVHPATNLLANLELTIDAVRHCNLDNLDSRQDLRGRKVRVWRTGKTNQSPARCSISVVVFNAEKEWPESFNVQKALIRVWSGETREKEGI